MKHLLYILIPIMSIISGCSEDINIEIPEDVEKADITGATVYNYILATIPANVEIDTDEKTVQITFQESQDLTRIKISLTISTGATIITPLGTGFLDFTSPKTVTIVSPGKTVESAWNIILLNPL